MCSFWRNSLGLLMVGMLVGSSTYAAPQQVREPNKRSSLNSRSHAVSNQSKREVPPEEQTQIFFPPLTAVEGDHYKLGEIATFEGLDYEFIEKIAQITIGKAPMPGGKQVVTQSLVLSKLRPHIKTGQVTFPGADATSVQRVAIRVPGEDIDQIVLNHVQAQYQHQEVKAKLLSKSRDVFLPKGELSYDIQQKGTYKKEGGYRTFSVVFSIDSKKIKTVLVRVYIKVYKDIFVAKDTIKQDHIVQETDLMKVRRNVDRLPATYIDDKNEVIGKMAKRTISPQEVMKENIMATPFLVETGERLLIVYETKSLRLTAEGIALSKGHMGDRIPVRNLESKTVVYANVKARNQVQVN
ncbi:flagellar basal body P-ring formation chaperone FlgA [Deltaproteobacteria bacterium TL4]